MNHTSSRQSVTIIRWLARALGIALAGLHGVFFFGHLGDFLDMHSPPPFAAWSSMLLLLIILSGYLVAWKFEATGAVMVISGAILLFIRADEMFWVYTGIASLPALMHLYCRFIPRSKIVSHSDHSSRRMRIIMTAAAAIPLTIAGLFVLEIFTHHGTPYTEKTLPDELAGTWSGTGVIYLEPGTDRYITADVTIFVHSDGKVTGMVDDTPITDAEIQKNRNWFYRKINFYTDYIIEGTFGGELERSDGLTGAFLRFPCNIAEGALKGTIFHMNGLKYNPVVNRLALTHDSRSDEEKY